MRKIITSILFLVLVACIEPLDYSLDEGNKLLIVEGLITDQPEPYEVKLSLTSAYENVLDNGLNEPLSGASVSVEVIGKGRQYIFHEVSEGTYSSAGNGLQGIAGEDYRLKIITPDENLYYSKIESLSNNISFNSVNSLFTTKQYLNEFNNIVDRKGMDISVDFAFAENSPSYIRWGYSYLKIPQNNPVQYFEDYGYINALQYEDYNRSSIDDYIVLFMEKPVGITDISHYKLVVYQYCVTEEVFNFWDLAARQKESVGTIFDPVISQVNGNIYNANNPNEVVLGIFSAAGVNKKTIEFDM